MKKFAIVWMTIWFFVPVLFQKRGYCVHLAALEYYLKTPTRAKKSYSNLEVNQEEKETAETQVTFEENFEFIQAPSQSDSISFLHRGQVEAGTNRIVWTLRIGLFLSQQDKFYVDRDIPLSLKSQSFPNLT